MPQAEDTPQPDGPRDDQASLDALDHYLSALHAGGSPDRKQLVQRHPELAAVLDCIEDLEKLAPPLSHPPGQSRHAEPAPTAEWAERGEATPKAPHELSLSAAPTLVPSSSGGLDGDASPEESPSAAVRAEFGHYELLEELGRGGMGVVYKARQRSLDRFVAIKMILANHLASGDQVERFYAEARAAAKLHHPNIVAIHEADQLHGQHYFAMEYVAGESLAALLRRGPLQPKPAAECVRKIARAVEHLHAHGIVHRDLKPSNILLDEHGEPYVTDFGLVKMLEGDSRMTNPGAIVGTPSYMAPEQAAARTEEVGPLSDVYSLGAILYELLTGRPPFREATPMDTLVQVLEGEPARPRELAPHIPRTLERICMRCLEKVPNERYPSAAALADDLDRFLSGETVEAGQSGLWQRVRRWARREPALASRLGLLASCEMIDAADLWRSSHVASYRFAEMLDHFLKLSIVFLIWAVVSVFFQRLLKSERWANWSRVAWGATDAVLTTAALIIVSGLEGPQLVVYPALIAASGLWFQTRLVWYMTGISATSYLAGLLLQSWLFTAPAMIPEPRHAARLIFVAVLIALGAVVSYLVHRVRVLSRYYEHRPLP